MLKILRFLVVLLLSQSLIFISFAHAGQLALPSGDLIAPQITHEPLHENVKAGSIQKIQASITDNVGIKTVTLFYRTTGSDNYKRTTMNQVEGTNDYIATLGFEDTVEPGIEYYIQAVDLAGNALLYGYSFSPLKVGVIADELTVGIADTYTGPATSDNENNSTDEKKKTNKWLWIGLGVLAVGVVAAVAGGGGDDGGAPPSVKPEIGRVSFSAPVP